MVHLRGADSAPQILLECHSEPGQVLGTDTHRFEGSKSVPRVLNTKFVGMRLVQMYSDFYLFSFVFR